MAVGNELLFALTIHASGEVRDAGGNLISDAEGNAVTPEFKEADE